MFFAKICSPWRKMLIQSYKVFEGQLDSVVRKMSFLKDKLKDWRIERVSGEPFPGEDHGGRSPKPEHINLDREQDQQEFHPKDLDEQMQDPLEEPLQEEHSEEPILKLINDSKTTIA
ncbi:UNVERIFIED_CONTAM: hypothetical protein Sindi_0059200 [Sesamum indicum]